MTTEKTLEHVRFVASLMDSQFSVLGFKFGLDGLIGAFPVLGDLIGGLVSVYIVLRLRAAGIPEDLAARMFGNILVDIFAGSIPVVGDLFDFYFKANLRNIKLAEVYFKAR